MKGLVRFGDGHEEVKSILSAVGCGATVRYGAILYVLNWLDLKAAKRLSAG